MTFTPPRPLDGVVYRWTSCTPNPTAEARAVVRRTLSGLGLPGETVSDAVLVVSEFVANAAEYAYGPYEVRIRRSPAEIICEVSDGHPVIPHFPTLPTASPFEPNPQDRGGGLNALCALLAERGRGLHIVDQLSRGAWGFRSSRGTKTAWAAWPITGVGARECDG